MPSLAGADIFTSSIDGTRLAYRHPDGLMPDAVTDAMAYLGAHLVHEQIKTDYDQTGQAHPVRVMELGVGVAPFLSLVAHRLRQSIPLELFGVDTSESALRLATHNVRAALEARDNPRDTMDLRHETWGRILDDWTARDMPFNLAGINVPYLMEGHAVRPDFRNASPAAMYESREVPQEHFCMILPHMHSLLKPGGFAIVRTPRDAADHEAVAEITHRALAGRPYTLHRFNSRSEADDRQGKGLVLQLAETEPQMYSIESLRSTREPRLVQQPLDVYEA